LTKIAENCDHNIDPRLIYNDEEDLAYKSMVVIRGEEYDASIEINRIKDRQFIYFC
jgi:hypothetical protein